MTLSIMRDRETVPQLERHCGSWIVVKDGKPLFETFDRSDALGAAQLGYEVLTAAQWLGRLNQTLAGSPYLNRPLRSLEQARRDIERKERIDG